MCTFVASSCFQHLTCARRYTQNVSTSCTAAEVQGYRVCSNGTFGPWLNSEGNTLPSYVSTTCSVPCTSDASGTGATQTVYLDSVWGSRPFL
jgi:hypothetical protein